MAEGRNFNGLNIKINKTDDETTTTSTIDSLKDQIDPCEIWYNDYFRNQIILLSIALFLAGLTPTLRVFIREITWFENKHTITSHLRSAATKMWTVQYVASALCLLLINAKYTLIKLPSWMPFLAGDYSDFTYEWYTVVGTPIVISTFISAMMHVSYFAFWIIKGFVRCLDRGCSYDMTKTKK